MASITNTARDVQGQTYTLHRDTAAIPISSCETLSFGPVTHLPAFSSVTVLGPGLNDRLVSVRCNNSVYCVFMEDLAESAIQSDIIH
jgi:spore coat protein U-like protein